MANSVVAFAGAPGLGTGVFVLLLAVVALPVVVLLRYLRFGTELRILGRRTRIDRGTALVAGLVAIGALASIRVRGPYPDSNWFTAAAAVFGFGVFLLAFAVANLDWYRALEVDTAETGFVSEGPVQVAGEAAPVDEPLVGPFSDEPCVAYEISVGERRWAPKRHGNWSTQVPIALEDDATRFTVDDGSGALLVDPTEADVRFARPTDLVARDATVRVEGDESPPAHVRDALEKLGIGPTSRKRTYRESHLQPGEEVYVVGSCESIGHGYEANRVVAGAGEAPAFVVTTGTVEEVRSSIRRLVTRTAALGGTLSVAGLLWMARLAW